MAITVRTIRRKPITLKNPGENEQPSVDNAPVADNQATPETGAEQSATPADASAAMPSPSAIPVNYKQPSYVFSGICGILVFIMFVTIVILQYLEWDYYLQPKCAFPSTAQMSTFSSTPAPYQEPAAPVPAQSADMPVQE